ncbi:hypothetical protein SH661x_003080 [Planctomicrobium sp. SH661]|uniref:hypothetical protein n=1 Tax=Planctomicrobium sp. SH661 TaxID=3448124 RepID=UPI003F5BBFCD
MSTQVTSFDSAQQGQFGDILNDQREAPRGPKVGLIACGYFEYWRMYPELRDKVAGDLAGIHLRLSEEMDIVYPGMIDTLDAAERAGRELAAAGVDVVVIVEGTYLPDFMILNALEYVPNAKLVLFNTQTGTHVNPADPYPATLRNSALIGIAQLTGTLHKSGRQYHVVVGDVHDGEAYREVGQHVRALGVAKHLRQFNIGMVGHVFRGMFDLEFDRGTVRGKLGPEVITIQAEHLVDIWETISDDEIQAATRLLTDRFPLKTISSNDVARSMRLGLAMRGLMEKYRLDALCFLGQHYLEKITHAPARLGASFLTEQDGTMVGCEGDIGGLIMMQMMHELTGLTPVQMEWGQFDLDKNALFLIGHGIATPEVANLQRGVHLTRAPEEWGFEGYGANWEMILKPGTVTMGHFLSTPTGWRMLLSRGESLDHPCLPCDEIHAMVQVKSPVKDYLKTMLQAGISHHVIVVHGDVLAELALIADAMGVEKLIVE